MGHYIPLLFARYAHEILKASLRGGLTMFKRKGAWKMPMACQLDRYDRIEDLQGNLFEYDRNVVTVLGMTRESILKQRRTEKRKDKED